MSDKEGSVLDSVDTEVRYAYVLINQNSRRGGVFDEDGRPIPEQEYKTNLNVLFDSSIIWPGGKDPFSGKDRPAGKYFIRFYDGCTTLFKDNQPQDKPTVDSLLLGTQSRYFNHGYLFVEGYEKMLKIFMDWTSLNEDSPYLNPMAQPRFRSVIAEKALMSEKERLDLEDKATDLAKNAKEGKMMSHANYLEIALQDPVTNVQYSPEVVRISYRKYAKENPQKFIQSYGDDTMEFKTKVRKLIVEGKLSTSLIPNMLSWTNNGQTILNVSGIDGIDLIVKKATEFSLTEEGKDFALRVMSVN